MAVFTHRRSGTARARAKNGSHYTRNGTTTLASATLMNRKQIRSATRRQSWHEEAWAMFDQCGELHAATRWLGNALSRARLFIAKSSEDGGGDPTPVEDPPQNAVDVLDELHAGSVGQGEMMRRLATNLDIVGEAFLIRLPKSDDPTADENAAPYRWLVASVDEFQYNGGRSRIKLPEDGSSADLDPEKTTVIRLWNPHPRQAWEADSPVRSNLPVLREVMSLSQHITATVESRLAGAGVLAIPKSATLPNPNVQEGANPLHHNAFVDALVQGMVTPITDRDNASAVVPIVISVDDEAIGKLQHLSFSTELDANVTEMRKDALARFAAGTDLPQEIITGLGESSHWNASEIEEQALKVAVEPVISVICDALTQQLLWPALRAMGEKDPEKWVIWYSTAELSQPPDRSAEAQALYDKGVLSPESLLRENGFNGDDRPSDDDQRKEFARQVVLAKPELIAPLAPFVGFEGMEDTFKEATQPAPAPAPPGQEGPADPEQDPELQQGQQPGGGGGQPPPPQQGGKPPASGGGGGKPPPKPAAGKPQPKAMGASADSPDRDQVNVEAVEAVALRALEKAGNRLLTNSARGVRGKPESQGVYSWDLHTVAPAPNNLDRLFDRAFDLVEPVFGDQPCVKSTVEDYCRSLVMSGRPHRREYLEQALRHSGCLTSTST